MNRKRAHCGRKLNGQRGGSNAVPVLEARLAQRHFLRLGDG
eukprot:CAMPEP_0181515260 /NCGR_PEP_ID=MMETSP1110-20121109/63475_1 /TAXON_ID=174948 /ORGANISM="Symbiodinium sp., Strain CCMP421" /LENGTH=40 /DNA_ID= /DNA_START= /DNA_END= /DNA_ORIENTATION=